MALEGLPHAWLLTCIARSAQAHDMAGVSVRVAGTAMVVLSTGIARTRTGTALLASAKNRISVVAIQTPKRDI